jgi:hypothetical protein
MRTRTLSALLLTAGVGGSASAQTRAEDILARKPTLPHVVVSTPAGAELAACKVEPVSGLKSADGRALSGVVVRDGQGRLLRQVLDDTGSNDLSRARFRSFYHNGVECYREIDADSNGKPDQYRFLGVNGSRWGQDIGQQGIVDRWFVLSPAEASQELFHALADKDARRFQALLPTEDELKAAGVPADEVGRLLQRAAGAAKRLQETAAALNLTDKDKWVHVELTAPMATSADPTAPAIGVQRHRSGTVLFDRGDNKTVGQFQTGELILVGNAWKLLDGPAPGQATAVAGDLAGGDVIALSPEAQSLLVKLNAIAPPADPKGMAEFHAQRAAILEQIAAKTQGAQQEPWIRQTIDALAGVAEAQGAADSPALGRARQWLQQVEAAKNPAAPYAAFRVASAEYAVRLNSQKDLLKVQEWWRGQLEAFVAKYPQSDETPEAMLRLAVAFEFVTGKEGEQAARQWYEKLAASFPNHPHGAKAEGAVRRLTSEGQPLQLPAATDLMGKAFDARALAGRAVVVYYWATWGRDTAAELKALGELARANAGKLEVVTINLDEEAQKAVAALNAAQVAGGVHLHQPGGLERSPLAVAYGIQMVPHILLVGKDGKVVSRNAQPGAGLKDEVEKLLK